jgi:hypothetical protein
MMTATGGAPAGGAAQIPLSINEESLLYVEWWQRHLRVAPHPANMGLVLDVAGSVNRERLEEALRFVAGRHEGLRACFHILEEGEHIRPGQTRERLFRKIALSTATIPLSCYDVSAMPEVGREEELKRIIAHEVDRPFDYGRAPLMRVALVRVQPTAQALILVLHHLISDWWSMRVVRSDLETTYDRLLDGDMRRLPEVQCQYSDFARWQRTHLRGSTLAELASYWNARWKAWMPSVIRGTDLPFAIESRAPLNLTAEFEVREVDPDLLRGLKELVRATRTTLYVASLCALTMVLFSYTRRPRIGLNINFANRHTSALQNTVGWCANSLFLAVDVHGDWSMRQLLEHVRATVLDVYKHQELPPGLLWETLDKEHKEGIGVGLLATATPIRLTVNSDKVRRYRHISTRPSIHIRSTKDSSLNIEIGECDGHLRIAVSYPSNRFDGHGVKRFADMMRSALAVIGRSLDASVDYGIASVLAAADV